MNSNGHKTIKAMANETRILANKLSEIPVGETAAYETMTEWIGKDTRPGGRGYSHVTSARRALLRDGFVFDCEPKVGLTRLNDEGKLDVAGGKIRSIHRQARKGVQIIASAEYNNLSRDKKTLHNTRYAYLGTIAVMTKPSAEKKVLAASEKRGGLLPTAEVLDQFR